MKSEDRPSANRILPEFHDLIVGDVVSDWPPDTAYCIVRELEPNRYLLLYSNGYHRALLPDSLRGSRLEPATEFSWVFVLKEIDLNHTRLLVRVRITTRPIIVLLLSWPFLMMGEVVFLHLMLNGIRQRVERSAG